MLLVARSFSIRSMRKSEKDIRSEQVVQRHFSAVLIQRSQIVHFFRNF